MVKWLSINLQPSSQPWGFGGFAVRNLEGGTAILSSWSFHSRDNSAGSVLTESLEKVLTSLQKFTLEDQDQQHHSGMRNGTLLSYLVFNSEIIALSNILKKTGDMCFNEEFML